MATVTPFPAAQPWAGIYPDIPAEDYHARRIDLATASGLKQVLRSPAHFKHWADNPDDDKTSPALTFGKALHMATLEPEAFARTYTVLPADAPKRPTKAQWGAKKPNPDSAAAMAWWRQWQADNAGKVELSADDYDRVQRMAASIQAHPVAAGLLVGGQREITLRWEDEATGLQCQARPDLYLPGEFIMDVKSCRDASHEGFSRAVHSYFYDLQQAHYLEGIRRNGDHIRFFVFLAVESVAPFVAQPYLLDVKAEERGFTLRQRAIKRQAECLKVGRWPGYSDEMTELHLPTYAYFGIED